MTIAKDASEMARKIKFSYALKLLLEYQAASKLIDLYFACLKKRLKGGAEEE